MTPKAPDNRKRPAAVALLALFFFTTVFGTGLFARSAQAQMAVFDAVAGANTTSLNVQETKNTTKSALWTVLGNAAAIALLNATQYFAQRIAYDTANALASAASGQKPLFSTEGLGKYLKNTAKDSAGEFLGSLSDNKLFKQFGVNLCKPSNPRIALNISIGFLNGLPGQLGGPLGAGQPQPKCPWNAISDNWSQFKNQSSDRFLDQVGVVFTQGQAPLSAAFEFNSASIDVMNERVAQSAEKFAANKGFKDLKATVSEDIKTPAENIRAWQAENQAKGLKEQGDNLQITGSAFAAGAYGVLGAALRTFTNTLAEKTMKKLFEKGMFSVGKLFGGSGGAGDNLLQFGASPDSGGRAGAELANADLLTPKIFSTTNYDPLLDFISCPPNAKTPYNCVIDNQLYAAISRANEGQPLTVRQAVEQGFVQGNWKLIPQDHPQNRDRNCYLQSFCYSNLVKMRLMRVLPAGWELAANSPANDRTNPVTLKSVMDGFDDCPTDASGSVQKDKLPDPSHPWCHLIDPNWVLMMPKSICRVNGAGPMLEDSNSPARANFCVDAASCIAQDANGNCSGGYGYCLREKTVWKFDADACPAQYASCQALRRADGQAVSYLMNTARVGVCTAANAGCRALSQVQNVVPNGGFENMLGSSLADWVGTSMTVDRSASRSLRGTNALGMSAASFVEINKAPILPGKSYKLVLNARLERAAATGEQPAARIEVKFRDRLGDYITTAAVSSCEKSADVNGGVFVSSGVTHLGYVTASCDMTTPPGTAYAEVILKAIPGSGGSVFFDEVGLYGEGFSTGALDTLFLNAKTESCGSDQVGCSKLMPAATSVLNFLRNPGFEDTPPDRSFPRFWAAPAAVTYEYNTGKALEGAGALSFPATGASAAQTVKNVIPNAVYTLSAYAKSEGGAFGAVKVMARDAGNNVIDAAGPTAGNLCQPVDPSVPRVAALPLPAGATYQQRACSFETPSGTSSLTVEFSKTSGGGAVFVDAAQLELSPSATAYHVGYNTDAQPVYLKMPPPGVTCTGGPNDPSQCAAYAPSCRREDIGCNIYTPDDGDAKIPAATGPADLCPAECAGYATFRQEPTDFRDGEIPVYFVPSTARACSASDVGCEEFTNLSRLASGGEARETYSRLRLCQKPDDNTGTFYTWEGSESRGYQLKVWSLQRSNLAVAATGPDGSDPTRAAAGNAAAPCTAISYDAQGLPYCSDTAATLAAAACSRSQISFNPDCREFYDADGNIHYRLYSKTIVASDDCTEYRLTRTDRAGDADRNECVARNGLWKNNECHYFAVAKESASCSPSAVSCRAYGGNASRNIRVVLDEDFEGGTRAGWPTASAVEPSSESVSAGGRSMKLVGTTADRAAVEPGASGAPPKRLLTQPKLYLLSFWAKGTGDLKASLVVGGIKLPFQPVALTTDWKIYTIGGAAGALAVDRPTSDADVIRFETDASADGNVFIDNLLLKEVADSVYVIKDSWQTPASCDRSPTGAYSPQYMLGCRSFTDRNAKKATFKSFSRLCRAEAVGCEAFYDTHDSVSPFPATYNAVCTLNSVCTADGAGAQGKSTCSCTAPGGACEVTIGAKSCRYDADQELPSFLLSELGTAPSGDAVQVPGDNLVFLINDPKYRCNSDSAGCTAMGDKVRNPDGDVVTEWKTKYLKNQPDRYADTLCVQEEQYCQAYNRIEDDTPVYFKDPENHVCEYKENVTISGVIYNGWFKKGTAEPCYPSYLQGGSFYGLWKNSDENYNEPGAAGGWIGECNQAVSRCKEFIDPTDKSSDYPDGRAYYAIMNEKLDVATCKNQVSRITSPSGAKIASACVLFKQADDLHLTYNAGKTYAASEARFGALVDAVDGQAAAPKAANDANIVIRVSRDRECARWLDCRTSETVFNQSTGQHQNVCTSYGVCAQYLKSGDSTRCVRYVESETSGKVLTPQEYAARNVKWDGMEYSGYSIPGRYPVDQLRTVDLSDDPTRPDPRLVYTDGSSCSGTLTACGSANNVLKSPTDPTSGNAGVCINKTCVWPIDGSANVESFGDLKQNSARAVYPEASCRAYPRVDSPFPGSVADPGGWDKSASEINAGNPRLIGPAPAYANANVCQRRVLCPLGDRANCVTYDSCECGYIQGSYGAGAKRFFPINGPDLPAGYCGEGEYEGYECDPTAIGLRSSGNLSCCSKLGDPDERTGIAGCEEGGACQKLSKVDYLVGYEGQCLERDLTTPINNKPDEYACLTWRPVGLVGGSKDIYNLNRTAGYFTPIDRKFYCSNPHGPWVLEFSINTTQDVDPRDNTAVSSCGDGYCNGTEDRTTCAADCKPKPIFLANCGNNICAGTETQQNCFEDCGRGPSLGVTVGPWDQPTMKYFGPGKVSKPATPARSYGNDCENRDHGAWCLWPGLSDPSHEVEKDANGDTRYCDPGASCGSGYYCKPVVEPVFDTQGTERKGVCTRDTGYYNLTGDAIGILGCYEIADDGTVEESYIDYPYIGPAIYRDQLSSVFFQMTADIYDRWGIQPVDAWSFAADGKISMVGADSDCGSSGCPNRTSTPSPPPIILNTGGPLYNAYPGYSTAKAVTNPYQHVVSDCSDEGDNIVPNGGNALTRSDVEAEELVQKRGPVGVYHLSEGNSWKVDAGSGSGHILLSAAFDKATNRLASLRVAATDNNDEGSFGIYKMGFVFKAGCGEIARVDQANQFGLTVAYTDRLNSSENFEGGGPATALEGYAQACRPWGAIGSVTQNPPDSSAIPSPWSFVAGHKKTGALEDKAEQCTVASYRAASIFTSGETPIPDSRFIGKIFRKINQFWRYKPMGTTGLERSWCESLSGIFASEQACLDAFCPLQVAIGRYADRPACDKALGDPRDTTKSFKINAQFTPVTGGFLNADASLYTPVSGKSIDKTGADANFEPGTLVPPRLASVDILKCRPDGSCPVKSLAAFSINGRDGGIQVGQNSIYPANVQFYAWGSHNAMPIVGRTIIWGDGAVAEPPATGWYKNRKPYCSPDDSDATAARECQTVQGLTCRSDLDCPGSICTASVNTKNHFGNTPGACSTEPFKFDHTYTCTVADIKALARQERFCTVDSLTDRATNAPCLRDLNDVLNCVYRPIVQVKDNWGWCNCTGRKCQTTTPWGGAYDTGCNLPAEIVFTDPNNVDAAPMPFTPFNGEIRVAPSKQDYQEYLDSLPRRGRTLVSSCGNGLCDGTEDPVSCPADC